MTNFSDYYAELFEALFSFDEEKIRDHLSAYNVSFSEDEKDGLWHTVCEILVEMNITPEDVREMALNWLMQHGYRKRKGRRL